MRRLKELTKKVKKFIKNGGKKEKKIIRIIR